MILEFNKDLRLMGADFPIKDESGEIFCKLDFIKGGILLNNKSGKLIAQILSGKEDARISIADSPSLSISRSYDVSYSVFEEEDADISKKSMPKNEKYFTYGLPNIYQYDLYLSIEEKKYPECVASVISHPWNEEFFKVKIYDGFNRLKVLSIILTFALINMD